MSLALGSGRAPNGARQNRRRVQRIRFVAPLSGAVGSTDVTIVDLSLTGAGIEHRGVFQVGARIVLSFVWEGERVKLPCTVLRSRLVGFAGGADKATLYQSGLLFEPDSTRPVRQLIENRVERALEEQRANARGEALPPRPVPECAKRELGYVCYRLEASRWRRAKTRNPEQPAEGFTVCASEDPDQLDLLCSVYERCNPTMRNMIRILAKISVSEESRESYRRYIP